MSERTKIERVPREVIETKVLLNILEEGKVAILATEDDLRMFIVVFSCYYEKFGGEKYREYKEDLEKLRDGAFP